MSELSFFTNSLLAWYAYNRRELPWREQADAYHIWVSEIILQQTRVKQGYDYYLRFVDRFPTVEALAAATVDEVLKLWQGLGYYSRARNLHAAAQSVVRAGGFPTTYEEVRALRGVGDYTAAAICSFAYAMDCAVVDGNVYRVLARYFGIDEPIDSPSGKRTFASLAHELLPSGRAADYNQAIMDFGAMQCTPQKPRCLLCPLAESCVALGSGKVDKLPVKAHRTSVRHRYFNYIYIGIGGSGPCPDEVLLRKRPEGDIWQGLYELPLIESDGVLSMEELLRRGGPAFAGLKLAKQGVKHVLSHQVIHADFYMLRLPARPASAADTVASLFADCQQVPFTSLAGYPVSKLIHAFLSQQQLL